jgi:actin-related protein 8
MDDSEPHGSKIVVIHPGSQYLRIGFANDALPRTVPMVMARRWKENEAEENGGEPLPKRLKSDEEPAEKWFGDDVCVPSRSKASLTLQFSTQYTTMSAELRTRMRNSRVRLTPNAKDLVIGGNKKHWRSPEHINEHNDPNRIEWTETPDRGAPDFITGHAALRIPENSKPRYKLFWPIRHGWPNEKDYQQKNMLLIDYFKIIDEAMRTELGVTHRTDLTQYSCVFVIPDLYEKNFIATVLDEFMRDFGFKRVCFIQESLAASFGAGYSISCVVDVGAQKTSVCCVEDGMCVEDSRVNLKYGGMDVTELFMKMMLYDYFPYADINLKRRYDFLLAEELKQKYTHMNERDIVNVITNDFHVRAAGQDTCKFQLKVYDSPMLAPMVDDPQSCCPLTMIGIFPTEDIRL